MACFIPHRGIKLMEEAISSRDGYFSQDKALQFASAVWPVVD